MKTLRLVLAQSNFLVGDIDGNARKIIDICTQARQQYQADLILFPELALVGYPPEDLLLRQDLYRRCQHAIASIQQHVGDVYVVLGVPLRAEEGVYNAALVMHQRQIIARYYKHALPNYSVFDEKRYFVPGDEPCVVEIAGVPMGITICEDIWVDAPVQRSVAAGARIILNINASPYHLRKDAERHQVVRRHIRQHGIPVAYVNQIGGQDELVFDGASFVMNAKAECVFQAPAFEEGLYPVVLEIEDDNVNIPAQTCAPVLSEDESAYRALVTGVRDYVRKNNFNGVVIGLSGGIDSALTLAIVADAIGADAVEGVLMPSRYTSTMSVDDAKRECDTLGVKYEIISIEPAFMAFLDMLEEAFAGLPVDTTEENIQARCRGLILMAIANKKRKIAMTTGNKSEMAVGYATLYGDMAGGFDVLKDVPKTLVYRLARWCNREREIIPQRVIDRPPSAELAPDQKDSDSLPDYAILDQILARYVEQDQSPQEIIAAGFDEATVQRVIRMVDGAEHKRRQAPPGVRITPRAFGRDRRYPLTSGYHRHRQK
ncbi:MAG: NAD+ synthase [Gammaproteobacteria bacterium]|nr:NAD+ synthase [Gammaproteobacteria bacterium]